MDSRSGSSVLRFANTLCAGCVLSVIIRYPFMTVIRMYISWLESVQRDHLMQRSLGATSNAHLSLAPETSGGVYGPEQKPREHGKAGRFLERARPCNVPALPYQRLHCALAESAANAGSRCS